MSNSRTRTGPSERGNTWAHFRRTCGLYAQARHNGTARAEALPELDLEVSQEPSSELLAEYEVQREVQRRLAREYAAALVSCQRLQEDIHRRGEVKWDAPCAELDSRLEREVLELAVCEEAYELVSEELDLVRRELARRGTTAQ